MAIIEVKKLKDINLEGGTIIEGFPGVGLVSTIVGTYLISSLNLDQICALDSEDFPPTSIIYASKPKFPARIYASEKHKLGVFVSEFTPDPPLHRPIASTLLKWCKEQKCIKIISTEAMPYTRNLKQGTEKQEHKMKVYGIGSTDRAREELNAAKIEQLNVGIVYGVSGILLNKGRWEDFDVITILAEAHPDRPDDTAAAKILEVLARLMPHLKIDIRPLYEESKKLEKDLKLLRKKAKAHQPESEAYRTMYR